MAKITIRLVGGLGNQLHGYAFGVALSKRLSCHVEFDCDSGYWSDQYDRKYLLDEFPSIKIRRARIPKGKVGIIKFKIVKKLSIFISSFLPLSLKICVLEGTPTSYRPDIFNSKYFLNPYLMGYWASYRYLESSASCLRKIMRPPIPKESGIIDHLIAKIKKKSSCFIHYRSYEEEKIFSRDLREYYKSAVEVILKRIPETRFYVFSDNIDLARYQLEDIKISTDFIDLPGDNPDSRGLVDFYLMYICDHAIIGDSTFSWWAAWLSDNPQKIVISPSGISAMQDDWVPPGWEKLPCQSVNN